MQSYGLLVESTVTTLDSVKAIIGDVLQLGPRRDTLTAETPLLGNLPELDSMAVVALIAMIEEKFGILIDDDEVDASTFATLGTLTAFVEQKLHIA